jgi:hypothetical protein
MNNFQPIASITNYEKAIEDVTRILISCLDIYFGLRSNQVSENLIMKAQREIFSKFNHLSVEDVEYSFERFDIPVDKSWKNITFQEIMNPIIRYSNIKNKINNERIKLEREISEFNERKKKESIFHQQALKKYAESLKINKWIGDMYEAKVLLNKFTKFFNESERIELKRQAKYQFNQIQEKNDFDSIIYTEERLLAQLVVQESINRKIVL